jgi:hypothetical protein
MVRHQVTQRGMLIKPVFERVSALYQEAQSSGLLKTLSPSLKLVSDLIFSILTYIENRPKSPKKSKAHLHLDKPNQDLDDIVDTLISQH